MQQVAERVEEVVVVKDLAGNLTVVLDIYHYNKFVDQVKMHLAASTTVNK